MSKIRTFVRNISASKAPLTSLLLLLPSEFGSESIIYLTNVLMGLLSTISFALRHLFSTANLCAIFSSSSFSVISISMELDLLLERNLSLRVVSLVLDLKS